MARAALRGLRNRGDEVVIVPQVLVEFWGVATRPVEVNGLGLDPERADRVVRRIEGLFWLLPDVPAIHEHWRRLVVAHGVRGRQVHDARLAAALLAHGVGHILTFNTADFARYPGLNAVHPREVVPADS